MKRIVWATILVLTVAGCVTPSQRVAGLRLGMSPQEVYQVMGQPFAVRAAKAYEDGTTAMVWEYVPPVFSRAAFSDKYDKTYWVYFLNNKVVQWGEPGDFTKHDSTKDVTVKDLERYVLSTPAPAPLSYDVQAPLPHEVPATELEPQQP